jgi:hypothetical protein
VNTAVVLHNAKGQRICGAKARRNPTGVCQNTAVMANGRCRMHNGGALRGADSHKFRTGRFSRYLPTDLIPKFQQAIHDPQLMELREDAALVDARMMALLQQLGTEAEASDATLARIGEAWSAMEEANTAQDAQGVALYAGIIREQLRRPRANLRQLRAELREEQNLKRRIIDSDARRQANLNQYISADRALALVGALSDAVRTHVTDAATLAGIRRDIARLTSGGIADAVDADIIDGGDR